MCSGFSLIIRVTEIHKLRSVDCNYIILLVSYLGLQVDRERLAAGARKFIYINSFFSIVILQMVMTSAENNHFIMVITFTKYHDSPVNIT